MKRFLNSYRPTWAIARTEIGISVRLIRTWFFVFIVAGISVGSYTLEGFLIYRELSPVSSSAFETFSPLLLPMSAYSEFQFLVSFGIVFLAFDFLARDKRARFDEAISTLPITNVQLVFGRAFGISALFYLVIAAFIGLYYLLGVICEFALPSTGFRRPELISTTSTLLFDVFPYVFFWTSMVMLITVLVRFRVIAAIISIGLMLLIFWAENNVSMFSHFLWGVNVLISQLPSEIAPTFPSVLLIAQRAMLVLLACALLYAVAKLYPRLDQRSAAGYLVLGTALVALWFSGMAFVNAQLWSPINERKDFYTAHKAQENTPVIDAVAMNGKIDIHPGDTIEIDIDLEMSVNTPDAPLVLSLNPGYEIKQVTLNDRKTTFTFENGLLLVESSSTLSEVNSHLLSVRAAGNLNTNFVDLRNSREPLETKKALKRALVAYGSHASINHQNYVALLPSVAWYPMPGRHLERDATQNRPRDFFDLDLVVSAPTDWHVGGPGKANVEDQHEKVVVRFTPNNPVHQVALFASEFERRSTEIEGIEFELLVSPASATNIDLFEPVLKDLKEVVVGYIQKAEDSGLSYPFDSFSVIEVPNYLHTYGLSTHMPSKRAHPGLFLLREGKFLATPFRTPIQSLYDDGNLTDAEKREKHLTYVLNYFNNDITGGNVLAAATNNLFEYQTYPTQHQAESLSFIFDYLIRRLFDIEGGFHSAYILDDDDVRDTTHISARTIASDSMRYNQSEMFFDAYANRPDTWEELLQQGRVERSDSTWQETTHHHAQILLGAQIGSLLIDLYGKERIAQLLASIRHRFHGESFTYSDLIEVGETLEMPLDEVMAMWFNGISPAGYRTSDVKTVRLEDSADGTPIYESSLFIENGEPHRGFFKIEYATEHQSTLRGYDSISTDVIDLPGTSSVEVAIQSSDPIEAVQLKPYLSLNRKPFEISLEREQEIANETRPPKPFVASVDWSFDVGNSIVIDDLDTGFSIERRTATNPFFNIGVFSITPTSASSNGMDAGLKSAGGFAYLSDGDWMRQQSDTAYGKYRKTFVRSESFYSAPNAHFTTNIPKPGAWSLEYHLPTIDEPSGRRLSGGGRNLILLGEGNNWKDFDLLLRIGDIERPIEFNGTTMQAGWNDLGTFELPNQQVTLTISSSADFGTTVIDAIRWTAIELSVDAN